MINPKSWLSLNWVHISRLSVCPYIILALFRKTYAYYGEPTINLTSKNPIIYYHAPTQWLCYFSKWTGPGAKYKKTKSELLCFFSFKCT